MNSICTLTVEMDGIWRDYGLEELQEGLKTLFPGSDISLKDLMAELLQGDVIGALSHFLMEVLNGMSDSFVGIRDMMVWLIVLGVVSSLIIRFVEIFDKHQVADLSFYFLYLLQAAVLLKCFVTVAETAYESMENIVLFVKLLVPTYLVAVGVSSGSTTVTVYQQLLLLLIYGVEAILIGAVIPMVYSYAMLAIVNGIFTEEKLTLLMELLGKGIGWVLKSVLGVVTGMSLLQAVIAPALDSVKSAGIKKAVSAIPGVGNAAEAVFELAVGSAVIIKNSIGVILLIALVGMCAIPLLKIFMAGALLKVVAAFMGIVSDKRMTACANQTGDAAMMLLKTVGTAMLLFFICISVVAAFTNRGIM